jgi:bacterioferritin
MNNHDCQPGTRVPRRDSRAARASAGNRTSRGDNAVMAIRLLNRALAIAQAAARRCERQYIAALRSHAPALAAAALAHANEAHIHSRQISARIGELGGETDVSDLTPHATVSPNPSEARLSHSLPALLCSHLMAERDAIESYSEIASFFRPFDSPTRSLIEDIATAAEQRKRELSGLLAEVSNP